MDGIPDLYTILLLQIIKVNGSVDSLVKIGYNYAQIAEAIVSLRQGNIIKGVENDIILTEEGNKLLKTLNKSANRTGISKWVSPKMDDKIEPIGIFDIYLPAKKTKLG
ncbi:hypothetical protein [Spirosoma endophyticum]|uniref:ArnR1-like winged helix-turn-helix domain-containing protein n=1 Tax=Spirosoma endophyticum TaxID=662367 RepID=A0A1I2E5P2_9BACT|nr:hypothetical protein [Spirosoma endophyticum]SFE87811.1 hypothetical protein SAMN05216167_12122 [Spirosoma endophyticum]